MSTIVSSVWHASVQNVAFFESFGVHVAQRNGEVAIAQRSLEESEVLGRHTPVILS
jgi:hypothetical protein